LGGLDEPPPSAQSVEGDRPEGARQPSAPPVPLDELLELPGPTPLGQGRGVLWNAVLPEQVVLLSAGRCQLFHLNHGVSASSASEGLGQDPGADQFFGCGRWDPHHAHSLSLAIESALMTVDTRTMKAAYYLPDAHSQRIRGIDYNPNRPHVALSCGDDYCMKYWDLRKASAPLMSQRAHSHWVTSAQYNRFHDQLVLSAGTDARVKLWRVSSLSSAPPSADMEDGEIDDSDSDGLVKTFEEHEQSVFGAAWSAADAWIFATLSLDGKAVINHVPPAEKYKILL